jgi:threonylcarbamoyladenosine tRNA methylthiotransferase MtaB
MVVITGCYAQLKPKEIAEIPGVDLVLGAAEKFQLVHHIKQLGKTNEAKICSCDIGEVNDFHSSYSINDRTRTFLKVQDGCDYNCSFCTIPLARGKSRSDSIDNVIRHAEHLASLGVKEIVLTGVNLGDFGLEQSENRIAKERKQNFFHLLQALDEVDGISRYRISSIEPNLLTNEIVEYVANSRKIMPHFHIPLQSGSNRILGLMRRRYKKELYASRVNLIKTLMPHCCIGADVIVGFPSESNEDFKETFDFLHSLDVSYLHVFTYSERDNTHALSVKPVVPMGVRHERNKMLRNLSYLKMQYFIEQHRGQTRKVLFERHENNEMMEGYSDNYIKITAPYKKEWVNEIVDWKI